MIFEQTKQIVFHIRGEDILTRMEPPVCPRVGAGKQRSGTRIGPAAASKVVVVNDGLIRKPCKIGSGVARIAVEGDVHRGKGIKYDNQNVGGILRLS